MEKDWAWIVAKFDKTSVVYVVAIPIDSNVFAVHFGKSCHVVVTACDRLAM